MRTQTRPTDDPDCRLSTPWAGLTPSQQRDLIKSLGGTVTTTDDFLSMGRSSHFERNKRIRETQLQGRAIDPDRDDLSLVADPRRHGRGQRQAPLAPARLLDGDAWNAIRGALGARASDIPYLDVLVASAQFGQGETRAIAEAVGITQRQVRNNQNRNLAWAREHLDPDDIIRHMHDPITEETVTRRPPSRAGRKRRGWVAPGPGLDLLGDRIDPDRLPLKLRAARRLGPRRPRVRPVCEGQMQLFDMAA